MRSDVNARHTVAVNRAVQCFCAASLLCLVALSPLVRAEAAPAAPAANSTGNGTGNSTRIISEKMTHDAAKNRVVFEGKVHVIRPTMEIWSDLLTITLDNSGKDGNGTKESAASSLGVGGGKVDKIIAERNVRIKQENKSGTCGKATYLVNAGKIVMEQNPVLVDGDNRIRGTVINYYTESGKSEVIGNVDVQFTTDDDKKPSLSGATGEKASQ